MELVNLQGLVYGNRLFPVRSSERRKQEVLRQFVNNSNRPLFYSVDSEQFAHGQGVRHYGFLKGGCTWRKSNCSTIGISA